MSKSRQPISFIATAEPEKAKVFYGEVLGLEMIESSPFALAFRDGDTMLRVQIVSEFSPAPHTVHGWQVEDIEREIEELASKEIKFLNFEPLKQDSLGIWTTPDGHKIAWFKDPSGNVLSFTQFD